MKKYISECIGTALFVLLGCGSAVVMNVLLNAVGMRLPLAFSTLTIAMVFGLAYLSMWFIIGSVSGCHINPAVSLGMLIAKRMTIKDFIGYAIAQFIGGFIGATLMIPILGGRVAFYANAYGMGSVFGTTAAVAFVVEVIMTFIVVSVFLSSTEKDEKGLKSGFGIALSLVGVHIFGAAFTGTSVNPARSLGTGILQGGEAMVQTWLFVVAPLVGGIIAALFYLLIRKPEKEKMQIEGNKGETEEIPDAQKDNFVETEIDIDVKTADENKSLEDEETETDAL